MSSHVQEAAQSQSRAQIRSLQHDLLGARDQQILREVDMVDKMPQRGSALRVRARMPSYARS